MDNGSEQQVTHIAVPVNLFQVVGTILDELPHKQVKGVMTALVECQKYGLKLDPDAKDGDAVKMGPKED